MRPSSYQSSITWRPHDGAALAAGAVANSTEANAASTKTARMARLDGWWRVAGVKSLGVSRR